jgi:hypothetical protein
LAGHVGRAARFCNRARLDDDPGVGECGCQGLEPPAGTSKAIIAIMFEYSRWSFIQPPQVVMALQASKTASLNGRRQTDSSLIIRGPDGWFINRG